MEKKLLHVGIDIGSTTTKIAAVDETGAVAYSDYQRHGAQQVKSVRRLLKQLLSQLPDIRCRLALTGSGAKELADRLHLPYVQEVVANSIAIRRLYHEVRRCV